MFKCNCIWNMLHYELNVYMLEFYNFSGLAFSSGLAATQTIINLLKAGDHVITTDDVYGGTNRSVKF